MKLQLLAIPLLVALMLSPLAAAAAGSITFSSPVAGASYSGQGAYTITGTITPTPSLPDNVNIVVTLQGQSSPLDVEQVSVAAGGTFTVSTLYGGNAAWVTGTYVITASDSSATTGTTTFTYTAGSSPPPTGTTLTVVGRSDAVAFSGQTAQIFALAYWNNGSAAAKATFAASVIGPTGTASSITWTKSSPASGVALWTATLPANTADGAYAAEISATEGGITAWTLTSFQVDSQIASAPSVTALQTSVTALQTSVTAITTAITALQTSVTGVQTSVTGLQTSITAAQASIAGVGKNLTTWGNSVTATLAAHTASLSAITSTLGTVNTNVAALGSAVSTLSSTVATLSTTVNTISSTVSTISTSISSLSSSIQTLTTDVTGVQTTVSSLSGLSGQMTSLSGTVSSLSSSVSNEQTYILVVAALAVITLVLELAILIRKMS